MKEEDLKLVGACLFTLLVSVLFSLFVTTDKVADRVVSKLKRDYVPGPYEPGFDPDKIPPGSINKN
jgi:hypothetical protein